MSGNNTWFRFIMLLAVVSMFSILIIISCSSDNGTGNDNNNNNNNGSNIGVDSVYPVSSYEGVLRLYVVEKISRWQDSDDSSYNFGFLDFALDSEIVLTDSNSSINLQVIWDGSSAGFNDISENNMMMIAALFNADSVSAYAYPEKLQNPFQAHYVDAAAGAEMGASDSNRTTLEMSHTVFMEECTATWCVNCPTMRHWLHEAYQQGDNFYYVALVNDKNTKAYNRVKNDYNYAGDPTCFIDGGHGVLIGGWSPETPYLNALSAAGVRAVPDIDLVISPSWTDPAQIQINVTVALGGE